MPIVREGTRFIHAIPHGAEAVFVKIGGSSYMLVFGHGKEPYLVDANGEIFDLEVSKK